MPNRKRWVTNSTKQETIPIEPYFVLTAPKTVKVGEHFRITYTVNTDLPKDFRGPSLSNIPNIEVLAGPYTSTNSSYQVIEGKSISLSKVHYTYTLTATTPGAISIPSASVIADEIKCTSNTLNIEIK